MINRRVLNHGNVAYAARMVARQLPAGAVLYGIPRGGVPASYLVRAARSDLHITDDPTKATVILDDIVSSGATMARYMRKFPGLLYAALYSDCNNERPKLHSPIIVGEPNTSGWLVFPWEQAEGHETSAEDAVVRMLQAIGEDPAREGLLETPRRVVKAWGEWFKGYGQDPADFMKTFEDGAEGCDEMVLLTDIPIYSHCEHHVTPFIGVAHVAYIPAGKIIGLSKIARVVEVFSRRLQVQERLTNQIANCLEEHLSPLGVAVVIKAKHFCMATRGVKMPNVDTTTSAMRGVFFSNQQTRAEFMSLVSRV